MMTTKRTRRCRLIQSHRLVCFMATSVIAASQTTLVQAQIIPDASLGAERSRLTPNVVINSTLSDRIDGGALRGSNLFHSFQEFNLNQGQRVYFASPSGVQTILSRVTGSNGSAILGQLGVDGAANLFLINPNGILFGRTASLQVRGSFVATTANGVLFPNGDRFSTNPADPLPGNSLLTVNPSALFFNRVPVQPITVNANLAVPVGKSLLLVGGDVTVDGLGQPIRLRAPGGRIEIGGLAQAGTIGLEGVDLKLNFPAGVARSNAAIINQAGLNVLSNGGGTIALTVENLTMTGSMSAGVCGGGAGSPCTAASLNPVPVGQPQAGDITIDATGTVSLTNSASIFNTVRDARVVGSGGNIRVRARELFLQSGAELNTSTFGIGDAGDTTLQIENSIVLGQGAGVRSLVREGATGNGGRIQVQARSLTLENGAQIAASVLAGGRGNGGDIDIRTTDSVTISGVNPTLRDSQGNPFRSALFVNNETNQVGAAGNIQVQTGRLLLSDGARIEASTTVGDGGNINLEAREYVLLRRSSLISTTAGTIGAGGDGGNITITTPFLVSILNENSDISANAFTGRGGRVTINAQGIYGLKFQNQTTPLSDITASSRFGVSGTVILNTPDVDPSRGVEALSAALVDPTDQIAEGCSTSGRTARTASRFVIAGRSGLPTSPDEVFGGDRSLVSLTDLVEAGQTAADRQQEDRGTRGNGDMGTEATMPPALRPPRSAAPPLVEAQGWVVDRDGSVWLVPNPVGVATVQPGVISAACERASN